MMAQDILRHVMTCATSKAQDILRLLQWVSAHFVNEQTNKCPEGVSVLTKSLLILRLLEWRRIQLDVIHFKILRH